MVPQFVARTAHAAAPGKDNILVVLEMTGGNDGLNTVIPYADDLYHKARPTLRQTKDVVIRLDDHVGLNSGDAGLPADVGPGAVGGRAGRRLPEPGALALRGHGHLAVGRSRGAITTGWLGRAAAESGNHSGGVPILHIGQSRLPLAVTGAPGGGAVTVNDQNSFRLELGGGKAAQQKARRRLLDGAGGTDREGRGGRPGLVRAATGRCRR